jgi:ABC-2 type transport system permease protein
VRLLLAHTRAQTLELARHPAYVVPTLLFPAAFFLVFAPGRGRMSATLEMAAFAGFAAIGVAFFQFGVGIATERASPWEAYLRTLPVGVPTRLGARVVSALAFAVAAAGVVVAVALLTTRAGLPPGLWFALVLTLLLGAAPFALLGIALGYLAPPRGALPIANLLYLALSYSGGLWVRPNALPPSVQAVSPYLPTRALADALAGSAVGQPFASGPCLRLIGFAALFALVAAWGYRREQGQRFR